VQAGEATIVATFGGKQGGKVVSVLGALTKGNVRLLRLECLGSCEDLTRGDGDFAYRVVLRAGAAQRHLAGTEFYPSPDFALRLATGKSFTLTSLVDFSVRDQNGQVFELEFRATEWDTTILGQDAPDSRMDDLNSAAFYHYSGQSDWVPEETNFITLGSGECRIRLPYQIMKLIE
jgi:hypothetical protein